MSKFVAATSYRPTPELNYQDFVFFRKTLISRFWLILFQRQAVKRPTGRTFFPHTPVMPVRQLSLLPRSYDGRRLAQNVSVSSYGVGVGLRISSICFATWLCTESKRVNGSVVTGRPSPLIL